MIITRFFHICLFSFFCILHIRRCNSSESLTYSHHLVLYECDPNKIVYHFECSPPVVPRLKLKEPTRNVFKLHRTRSGVFEVLFDRSNLNFTKFKFSVNTPGLTVNIDGEVRKCSEELLSSNRCTVLVAILASLCLLLFASLTISLIVLRDRKLSCFRKISVWLREQTPTTESSKDDRGSISAADLDRLKQIHENGLLSPPSMEPQDIPIPNLPRKSSLKPPREVFPNPFATENDVSIDPSVIRRKSIVTFSEQTEFRT